MNKKLQALIEESQAGAELIQRLTTTMNYNHQKVIDYVKSHTDNIMDEPDLWLVEAMTHIPYIYRAADDLRAILNKPIKHSIALTKYCDIVLGKKLEDATDGELFKLALKLTTHFDKRHPYSVTFLTGTLSLA